MQTTAQVSERAASAGHSWLVNGAVVASASLLMAACAQVSIPLWFTPVPITLQTFGVMLLALTLGGWRASAALVLYLFEGISGVPVFSPHGQGGIAQVLGPTGGFLMSYPFAALACGLVAHRLQQRSRLLAFSAGTFVCSVIIFAFGALWLAAISHQRAGVILGAAVLPFLPGEVLKAAAAIGLALAKSKAQLGVGSSSN